MEALWREGESEERWCHSAPQGWRDRAKPATLLAQLGHYIDPATGGLVPPVQPSTTFARDQAYAGSSIRPTPTGVTTARDTLRSKRCCVRWKAAPPPGVPLGDGAIAALFRTLRRGEAIVVQRPIYYGTLAWLRKFCAPGDRASPFRWRRSDEPRTRRAHGKAAIV